MSEHVAKSKISFVSKSHYDPVNYVTTICAIWFTCQKQIQEVFQNYCWKKTTLWEKYDMKFCHSNITQ